MTKPALPIMHSALRLAAFAVLCTTLLAGMVALTHERIAEHERAAQRAALAAVLPADGYDNDPIADTISLAAPEGLGSTKPQIIYRARRGDVPVAAVLSVVAPDGYAGAIRLLIGVLATGEIIGVRVLAHQETPGLADGIERAKSPWVEQFVGRSRANTVEADWRVRKDGGAFDQFAGATVTPRAIVRAVARALAWYDDHRDQVFHDPLSSAAP
jgi:electron transport complex protein RnfG